MLVRLQGALGLPGLIDQILLLPQRSPASRQSAGSKANSARRNPKRRSHSAQLTATSAQSEADQPINLVVGYNSSPKSQTALDLTLWLAHQTRLATRRQVTVQVVYVVSPTSCLDSISAQPDFRQVAATGKFASDRGARAGASVLESPNAMATATLANADTSPELRLADYPLCQAQQFEQADRILWQARCLANEWRGSLKTHLRFGQVAKELRSVAKEESAALLWLGCDSADNQIVWELGAKFPCPVLGVPSELHPDRYFES